MTLGGWSIVVSRFCKQELVAVFFWSNTYFADQIFVKSPTVLSDVSSKLLIFGECSSKASLPQINIPTLPTDPFQDRRRCQGPCSCMGGQRQGENNSGLNLTNSCRWQWSQPLIRKLLCSTFFSWRLRAWPLWAPCLRYRLFNTFKVCQKVGSFGALGLATWFGFAVLT